MVLASEDEDEVAPGLRSCEDPGESAPKCEWGEEGRESRQGRWPPRHREDEVPQLCRHKLLSLAEAKSVVDFVKQWRAKRFCTSRYIRQELKLKCSLRTIRRTLNAHGYYWRAVPKVQPLTQGQLAKRKAFVERFENRTPDWWQNNSGLVLDGVTLTKAPRSLSTKQKHAAQAIRQMWLRKGEKGDNRLHTYNRYGVQLGDKVPLWGGFSGSGHFKLRVWPATAKLNRSSWAACMPALRRAVEGKASRNIWHDNEKFLLQPATYRKYGLRSMPFPPNSGDLNPIETVWAWLRKDLARLELEDLSRGRDLSVAQFRQRAANVLASYGVAKPGEAWSPLQKLLRGMPARLARARRNRFGRCGK